MHIIRVLFHLIVAGLSLLVLAGCSHAPEEIDLNRAESVIEQHPDSALAILQAIDGAALKGELRARHALLTVKATDKAYIPHTSDSIIRIALDYFGDKSHGLRSAESHYYMGRVNADLGNYPVALKGFHEALQILADTEDSGPKALTLKGAALSQQGQILIDLRLFPEAIPFYREAIKVDSILSDTINLFYDLRDIAFTYIQQYKPDSAQMVLDRAMHTAANLHPDFICEIHELQALSDLRAKRYDRAATHLHRILQRRDTSDNSLTLSIIARIYANTDRPDSAAHYARLLQAKPFSANSFAGAHILAENALRSGDLDTISLYYDKFTECALRLPDEHSRKMNLPGHMFYRHMMAEIDNSRLRSGNERLTVWLLCVALVAATCIIILLGILYRHTYLRQKANEAIADLQHLVIKRSSSNSGREKECDTDNPRDVLVNTLLSRMEELAKQPAQINPSLQESDVVRQLVAMASGKTVLSRSSDIWDRLESEILLTSPDFRANIHLLLGNPSVNDYHIALLVKAGLTPTQISQLLSRAKGTISNNRQRMCERIFGRKISNTLFDDLIRLL